MKLILLLSVSLTAFFAPVQGILIAVGIAIGLDTITGFYKAKKLKQPIVSRKMSDIVAKMIIYETCIILLYIIDYLLLSEFMSIWFSTEYFFTKIVALAVVGIELTSMKENIEAATQKDIFKWLKSCLKRGKEIKNDIDDLM